MAKANPSDPHVKAALAEVQPTGVLNGGMLNGGMMAMPMGMPYGYSTPGYRYSTLSPYGYPSASPSGYAAPSYGYGRGYRGGLRHF